MMPFSAVLTKEMHARKVTARYNSTLANPAVTYNAQLL